MESELFLESTDYSSPVEQQVHTAGAHFGEHLSSQMMTDYSMQANTVMLNFLNTLLASKQSVYHIYLH